MLRERQNLFKVRTYPRVVGVQYLSKVRAAIGGLLLLGTTQVSHAMPGAVGLMQSARARGVENVAAVLQISSISDVGGERLFSGSESIEYVKVGGTPEFAQRLGQITDVKGSVWRGQEILELWKWSGRESAVAYAERIGRLLRDDGRALYL